MSAIKPKKMVSRNVAIALGIICILLIAVIAYFSITGISSQNSYKNLQNQNKQLQTWLDGNISSFETQVSSLNANITNLETWLSGNITAYNSYSGEHSHTNVEYQNLTTTTVYLEQQITNLESILDSNLSIVWINNNVTVSSDNYTAWYEYAQWAGYVSIEISNANSSLYYTNIVYSFHGVYQYNARPLNYGTSGTEIFLVPSFSYVYIEVGNNDMVNGATETVTVTYYY